MTDKGQVRHLTLREHRPRPAVQLTARQRAQLEDLGAGIAIAPTHGVEGAFDLTPGSTVGVVRIDDLDIVIEPKIPLDRLLFILSYTLGLRRDLWETVAMESAADLPESIVLAFVRHSSRALNRGVQQGYRVVDDSSLTVRGRIRVSDQLKRRFGAIPPIEITYDDFTVDIEINRLLRAATERLLRTRLRSERSRIGLRGIEARLEGVSLVPYDRRRLPHVHFSRLNERYRDAVTLAKLILRSTSFELAHGAVPASAFLVDMNKAFEDFVVVALREALGSSPGSLVQGAAGHLLFIDEAESVRLQPDLSYWVDGRCVFVGDLKYKRADNHEYPNADIYQATAYAVATDLREALLIYAKGEIQPGGIAIRHIGKRIDVVALDLTVSPDKILAQIDELASRILDMAARAKLAA